MTRVAPEAIWVPADNGYAVGLVPRGPVIVLQDSSAFIWETLQTRGREPFVSEDVIDEVIQGVLDQMPDAPRVEVAAQTRQFLDQLLALGLLVLD